MRWLILLGALLCACIFLPQIASTSLGKIYVSHLLHEKTRTQVTIGSLQFSWFGPQVLRQVQFKKEGVILLLEELKIAGPFWSFEGPIELKSEIANISGHLTKKGLTLNKPIHASILLTPELSAFLLKDINPFFITGFSAKEPLTLHVEPEGFFFPFPFSLKQLKIHQATLDLGIVMCRNGDSLAALIAILNAPLTHLRQMEVWFTPVSLSIEEGVLTAGRLDALLASTLHVCTWGEINLVKNQLDMTLGLPAATLQRAFGISKLPSNYVLKLPIRGTPQSPDLQKGAAAAKIGALIAAEQLSKKTGPLLDLFSQKSQTDVPPPKRPYPWEK